MIISFRSRLSTEQILRCASYISWSLCVILVLGFATFFLQTPALTISIPSTANKDSNTIQKDLSSIGSGPFALNNAPRSLLINYLEQKILLLGYSSRPDIKNGEKIFSLGIKDSDQKYLIKEGEKVFLDIRNHASGGIEKIAFSANETNSWIIPRLQAANSLLLQLTQDQQEQGEFRLPFNTCHIQQEKTALVNLFKNAKIWGKDKFFQQYGATEYRRIGDKWKIEILHENRREFLYVAPMDYLIYLDGIWKSIPTLNDISKGSPSAQIHFASSGIFEIDVWDEYGFSVFHGQLKEEIVPIQHFSPEQMLTTPKLRTAKQISCLIGKKRVLLKEGDWLFKTKNGWRTLKTSTDIDAYLNHSLIGEIFVFDGVEVKNGQYFLKGHWFNEMHTIMQEVTFPINAERKTKTKKKLLNSHV